MGGCPSRETVSTEWFYWLVPSLTTDFRWLYALILSEDANFKQKARLRSDNAKDPLLGPGWGTFVENEAYLKHVAQYTDQDEVTSSVPNFFFFTLTITYRFRIVLASKHYGKPTIRSQRAYGQQASDL
jgi:hypothetical protein